jgi:hypothetical protein
MTTTTDKAFGVELQKGTVALRVSKRAWYIRRSLNAVQTKQAAAPFDADGEYLSASKKLIDTKSPTWRAVMAVQRNVDMYWRAMTVPYPIKGIRLLNRDSIDEFEGRMNVFASELVAACQEFQDEYKNVREEARERLGDLYNAGDYPESIVGEFAIDWDYPSVEPPEYLKQLNPALYAREQQRIAARFDEAVEMAEAMFAAELQDLVARLVERLQPQEEGGKARVLKDALVDNLQEFIGRFKKMNIGSNAQLESMVTTCEQLISGVDIKSLRKDNDLRGQVSEALGAVKVALDTMVVDAPERAFAFDE